MPGYIIHLLEAEIVMNKIREKAVNVCSMSSEWENLFLCGSLLPDTTDKTHKNNSHFWNNEDEGNVVRVPDLDSFSIKYRDYLQFDRSSCVPANPLVFGYLAHLHLDKLFFESYFRQCVDFLNQNGLVEKQIQKIRTVYIKKENRKIRLEEFFSQKYLYGDYTKLNHYLIQKYSLKVPDYQSETFCPVREVKYEELQKLIVKLEQFLSEKYTGENKLKVFSIVSLETFLEETAEKLIQEYGCEHRIE